MKHALVTGGAGFIGNHLVYRLLQPEGVTNAHASIYKTLSPLGYCHKAAIY
ncbi:hypothetical protein AN618_04050 [Fervidicola ferrireducens]|uniref:NAD-dependent epimerase/dehydratase domain-containing protein n=1 Tax=Fervidicola ferrireducens TaxID=520764 RepID=A0A140LCR4_9FIRM|nr:hypothetical protein AN618_04050 [Fervidicola ferrireducens]